VECGGLLPLVFSVENRELMRSMSPERGTPGAMAISRGTDCQSVLQSFAGSWLIAGTEGV
jgi:hypothetical protein